MAGKTISAKGTKKKAVTEVVTKRSRTAVVKRSTSLKKAPAIAKNTVKSAVLRVSPLIARHQKHQTDTGSTPVQVSLLSAEITELLAHLKKHPKDSDSRLGLIKKVGRRRKLLNYLERQDEKGYLKLTSELGLKA